MQNEAMSGLVFSWQMMAGTRAMGDGMRPVTESDLVMSGGLYKLFIFAALENKAHMCC